MTDVLPAIRQILDENQILVLTAEPGAGKTTLVPPALLEEPWLRGQKILLLEPRRVAARAAAERIAFLRGERAGKTVGWRMSQDTMVGPETRLEVLTEGVLTRMIQADPGLEGVGLILFDEFHERSVQGDLGWALALDVRRNLRPDLRLGLLSATLDAKAVVSQVSDARSVHAPGRVYPIVTEYRPPRDQEHDLDVVVRLVREAWGAPFRGILVFLPGWAEIRRVQDRLSEATPDGSEVVLVLHGSLDPKDQAAVLKPLGGGQRKTVLATTVAETSVTIPDIDLVIDLGLARVNRFDQGRSLDRLVTERVSQASADQRRGRAGRTGPGTCWRVWPSSERLVPALDPEILRSDLAPVALEAAVWGARRIDDLPWMTRPSEGPWNAARTALGALGLVDHEGVVTEQGKRLVGWGVEPRLGVVIDRASPEDKALACACVALLQDRDPLPQLADPDFRRRLEPLLAGSTGPVWGRLGDAWRLLCRKVGRIDPVIHPRWHDRVGTVLAPGFPELVGRRIDPGLVQLAGGRMARIAGSLADASWVVVLDADAGQTTGRVRLAVPVDEALVRQVLETSERVEIVVTWDGWKPKVTRVRRSGVHEWERTGLSVPQHRAEVEAAVASRLASEGAGPLPWAQSSQQFVRRMAFLGHREDTDWTWLAPYGDYSGAEVFTESNLRRILEQNLPWELTSRLDREAPETFVVPSGSRRRLEYRDDGTVVLEVRIQEVFGLASTPLLSGKPIVMQLLSPAQRPLQVTQDLASFWVNTYPEVRKEMRGRYPRHYWPENPREAEPTSRAKPRGL